MKNLNTKLNKIYNSTSQINIISSKLASFKKQNVVSVIVEIINISKLAAANAQQTATDQLVALSKNFGFEIEILEVHEDKMTVGEHPPYVSRFTFKVNAVSHKENKFQNMTYYNRISISSTREIYGTSMKIFVSIYRYQDLFKKHFTVSDGEQTIEKIEFITEEQLVTLLKDEAIHDYNDYIRD